MISNRFLITYHAQPWHRSVNGRQQSAFIDWLGFCLLTISVFMLTDITGAVAEEVVSGVLESVSLDSHTVKLRNTLGQPILLKLTKSHLLEHVTPGDRVTVVINDNHEIMKLIETSIPEMPPGHKPAK